MKGTLRLGLAAGVLALTLSQPAQALFVNGGFESGDTGWTISGDHAIVGSFTPQYNVSAAYSPTIPAYGTAALQLGSADIGNVWDAQHTSSASQTGTVTQSDIDNGAILYFRWSAFLEEPTNNVHPDAQQPYFSADLSVWNGSTWDQVYYADHRANQSGFQQVGTNRTGDSGLIWYGTDLASINLAGFGVGTQLRISLFVQDCLQGGHGGLVFLDGFGTERPPDNVVPEPGTMCLFGIGLTGLAFAARRRAQK